jgi:probable F420-dependent oxidoreductase
MRFGVHLPNSGGGAVSPDSLAEYKIIRDIATEAEKLGFDSLWANEHVTPPTDQTSRETKFFEPLTLLSALASVTIRIVLGTAIIILPFRDPFVLAKEVSTLSEISGHRFVLGVGPGRFEREYSSQSKNWGDRNKIMVEQIRLIRELFSGNTVNFSGKFYSARDLSIRPIPRKLPVVLGGSSAIAIRRATRWCDGIMPGHITVDQAKEMKQMIDRELEEDIPPRKEFTFYDEIIVSIDKDPEKAKSRFLNNTYVKKVPYATDLANKALIGTSREILDKLQQYARAGVQEFVLIFADETEEEFLDSMSLFSSKIMGALN